LNPAPSQAALVSGLVSAAMKAAPASRAPLAAMLATKMAQQSSGVEVAKRVVEGRAEFGLTLSGEIASVPDAVIAGPVPPPFGQDTIYCAAVMAASGAKAAAQDLIAALTRPGARSDWTRAGFELPN
jgi:ABC-type molybdate transport system substrate-binding protein